MAVLVVWMFLVTAALVRLGLVVGQFRREIVRKLGDIMAFLDQLEADVTAKDQNSGSSTQYTLTRKGEKAIRDALMTSTTN